MKTMKIKIPLMLFPVLFALVGPRAEASWLIDAERFHVSAHGQISCQDCHEEISIPERHPDPRKIGRERMGIFDAGRCYSCHDDVESDLDRGIHGKEKARDPWAYEKCTACHQPHYQALLADKAEGKLDPARPIKEQCGSCHERKTSLPKPSVEDEACMACHLSVPADDLQASARIARLCFNCHGLAGAKAAEMAGMPVSPINEKAYRNTPHSSISCTVCHPGAVSSGHASKSTGECRQCHLSRHDEKVAHDAHVGVTCEACHMGNVEPFRDPVTKRVEWRRKKRPDRESGIHRMVATTDDETACTRCHFQGNQLGAVAMVLPSKSILCMPCHTATFSVRDTTTVISLVVLLFGMASVLSYWLSATLNGTKEKGAVGKLIKLSGQAIRAVFSRGFPLIVKAIIIDVIFQRRLLRQAPARWCIHSLIFLPFVFRFGWGIVALTASLIKPEWSWYWFMLDKNDPVTGLLFDVTGIMVISGVCLAGFRGIKERTRRSPDLPGQDYLALSLMAGIILFGFLLEGVRIAMTGAPGGASYSFVGYAISRCFSDISVLEDAYGFLWYFHAVLTGAFAAYLPFSRMFHIVMGPIVLAMNAVSAQRRGSH